MLEVTIWSLLVGNLGWQAVVVSGWLRWRQTITSQQHQEEEEILTFFESKDNSVSAGLPPYNGKINSSVRLSQASTNPLLGGWEFQQEEIGLAGMSQRNGRVDSQSRPEQASTDPQMVGWEFKIVRASRDLFRNPVILQQLCKEEAIAGWILLEKLDDRRVRFKRLIALRNVLNPENLPHDPYRSHYGSSFTPLTWIGAIAALTAIVVPSYLGYTWVSTVLAHSQESPQPSPYEGIPPQDFPPAKQEASEGDVTR
jgi:hypothetical protein